SAKHQFFYSHQLIQNCKMSLKEIRNQILNDHNECRYQHRAMPLRLDVGLNGTAQYHADNLAEDDGGLYHSGSDHGENIYACTSGFHPTDVTNSWYSEAPTYNYAAGGFSRSVGHFTAMVWRATSQLGVGIAQSRSGKVFVVAHYSPTGNVAGQYTQNVLPPQSR
ncbi:hypothetical protein PENTCL1PPCAC_21265, partial [Pristionchus entomophagus]